MVLAKLVQNAIARLQTSMALSSIIVTSILDSNLQVVFLMLVRSW